MTNIEELEDFYDEDYYKKRNNETWLADAKSFSKAVDDLFDPNSVVDLGCGTGIHLKYFEDKRKTIKGIDGCEKAKKHAVIPQEDFEIHDLRESYEFDNKYDIVFCIEVLEHLKEEYADQLVDTITDASNTLVVTAAAPGQPGKHHVNLKPKSYWKEKFGLRGYRYSQKDTAELVDQMDIDITKWIPRNLMVFRKRLKWK